MWYVTTSLLARRRVRRRRGAAPTGRRRRPGPAGAALPPPRLTAFVALVQFPFGAPVYFCFVAPLAVLAWLAMFRHTPLHASVHRIFPTLLLAAIVGLRVRGQPRRALPGRDRPNGNPQTVVLDRDRAWIRVSPSAPSRLPRDDGAAPRRTPVAITSTPARTRPRSTRSRDFRNPTRSLFDYLDPSGSARGRDAPAHAPEPRRDGDRHQPRDPASRPRSVARTVARLRDRYPHPRAGRRRSRSAGRT